MLMDKNKPHCGSSLPPKPIKIFLLSPPLMETGKDSEKQNLVSKGDKDTIDKWLVFDIICMTFWGTLCSSVPTSFFAIDFVKRGGDYDVEAGMISQAHQFMLGLSGWLFGKLIPQFGYKRIVIFGVLVEGTAQIGFAFISYIENITVYTIIAFCTKVLTGLGNAASITTVNAIAATEFGIHSTLAFSLIQSTVSFSYLVGPSVGALLFTVHKTMFLPLILPGIAYLLSFLRFVFCYKQMPSSYREPYTVVKISSALNLVVSFNLLLPTLLQICSRGTYGYIVTYLPIYMKENGQYVIGTGLTLSLSGLSFIIGSIVSGKFIPHIKCRRCILLMVMLAFLGWTTSLLSTTISNNSLKWLFITVFTAPCKM